MRQSAYFQPDMKGYQQGCSFVESFFQKAGIRGKEKARAMLIVDEAVGSLYEHRSGTEDRMHVRASKWFGNTTIELSMRGNAYDLSEEIASATLSDEEEISQETQSVIRNILLRSKAEDLKYSHRNGTNYIRITVDRSRNAFLFQTLGAMVIAVIIAILLDIFAPEGFNKALDSYLLIPVKTIYLNALKMVVAPVVFFSIVSCIVQFSDLSELGRIGGKTIACYLFTTVIAVGVGLGAFYLFQPGDASLARKTVSDVSAAASQSMTVSLKDTIVGIVPSNFLNPFLESNMMQLIFLAVVCGIATGLIGKYSGILKDLFQACNDLFLKITTLFIRMMPVAVFCSIASMMLTLGYDSILSVLSMVGTFLFGLLMMMCLYCLMIMIGGRISPIPFVKKYAPVMLQVFSMASSNASIPINMDACEKKLGISRKVYSLSIPLGATLNMDGTCIHLAVFSLALARVFGVPVTDGGIFSLIISIIVLSIGAPGVPGSGLICLSVLLTQLNVPVEALGLVMGIDAFMGMFRCMSNCLGDVAVSTIVARTEGEIDMKVYENMNISG